jgi:integrase
MRPFDTNPCRGVKKFKENSRSRFLQPSELQRFFRELDARETPELFRDYIYISLLTGARRSNILSMRWSEIDVTSRLWRIPSNKSKNAEEMTVPLTREAIDILERRKRTARSVFVFPSSGKTGHLQEPRRPWKNLLNRADIDDLRLHDLRRTLGSYQTITGASTAIVGKTLGHKSPEATAVYARLNLDPVRQSIENATAAMLALKEAPDKIITITPAKGNTGT